MSASGHSQLGRASLKSGHVRYAAESGSFRELAAHDTAVQMIVSATRYDKLSVNYLAFIKLASIRIWLRANGSTP